LFAPSKLYTKPFCIRQSISSTSPKPQVFLHSKLWKQCQYSILISHFYSKHPCRGWWCFFKFVEKETKNSQLIKNSVYIVWKKERK
jgi:hypothetical protein